MRTTIVLTAIGVDYTLKMWKITLIQGKASTSFVKFQKNDSAAKIVLVIEFSSHKAQKIKNKTFHGCLRHKTAIFRFESFFHITVNE